MIIIGVVNQKGGSGKTTTALGYLGCLLASGIPSILIDTDKEGKAAHILATNGQGWLSEHVYLCESGECDQMIEIIETSTTDNTQVVIIDTPPDISNAVMTTGDLADVLVVPGKVSSQDINITIKTAKAAARLKKKPVFIQPTDITQGQIVDDLAIESYSNLDNVVCLPSIRRSTGILKAGNLGLTIFEYSAKEKVNVDYEHAIEVILQRGLKQ